jgi:thymidylate kinase
LCPAPYALVAYDIDRDEPVRRPDGYLMRVGRGEIGLLIAEVSDRYAFSSFAFGAANGVDLEWLIELNKEFLLPDATFLLSVDPRICLERIEKRGTPRTLFEEEQRLEKVWHIYKTFKSKFPNVHVVDGEQPIERVAQNIHSIVRQHFSR